MSVVNYNPGADGPSSGAQLSQIAASNTQETTIGTADKNRKLGYLDQQYSSFDRPALESTLGANGQYNSGARGHAEDKLSMDFTNASGDVISAFSKAQADMQRQQVFAGLGMIL